MFGFNIVSKIYGGSMQVNLNTQNYTNPYFGAIKTDRIVDSIIWLRSKKPSTYKEVHAIINSMSESSVDANLYRQGNSRRLGAVINEHNGQGYVMKESLWDSIFHSPAKFIAAVRDKMIEMEMKG
jgi:hypothetical protein